MIDGNRMRNDWNARASNNAMEAVVNNRDDWDEADFLASGLWTVEKYLVQPVGITEMTCLEIGCGAGRLTTHLSKIFKRVIALDVSDVMLDNARRLVGKHGNADRVLFVHGNGIDFHQVEDEAVDYAFSVIVFQHIPSKELQYGYLREMARVLKPGGHFSITLYSDMKEYNALKQQWELRRVLNDLGGWSEKAREELPRYETGMCNAVPVDETREVIADAGMNIVAEDGAGTGVWWIMGRRNE